VRKSSITIVCMVLFLGLLVPVLGCGSQERLRVATTTSLYDTGLWDHLEPLFEESYDVEMDVVYAGTGIALGYGRRGDVDAISVHSKSREEQFVAEGYGVERVPFAYNYFLIVGPEDDPAGIKGMTPEDALRQLARNAGSWYIEAGRGMGPTLLMASEKRAYTLSDMGTYLSYQGNIELVPIVDKGSILLNVYSVIAVNPEKNSNVKHEMAQNLVNFLTSPEIQELISDYGTEEYGMALFTPCAGAEPQS